MVYRYDVNVNAIIPSTDPTKDARKIDITKGPRDDAAKIDRNRLCLEALKRGLELYNVLSQNGAAIHDGAAILYSNEDIAHVVKDQVLSLDAKDVPRELTAYIGRPDISTFEITITNVAEGAYSFDMADLHSQLQRDMSQVDTSLKQFYEILMNSDAAHNRDLVIFGGGKIFSMDKKHLRREAKGHEYREGMDKSVKFIEGDKNPKSSSSEGSIVPALLLDSKVGTFFKQNTVLQLYRDIYHGRAPPFNFRFAKGDKKLPEPWPTVEKQIKGLRVHILKSNNQPNISSYVASTLSKMPISELRIKAIGTDEYEPLSDYFKRMGFGRIDPQLPAVMISLARKIKDNSKTEDVHADPNQPTSSKGDEKKMKEKKTRSPDVCDPSYSYYPMEHCIIAANQRVSRQKMLSDPERAVPPHKRYEEILNGLHALNLDESGRHNRVLAAFGVEVSSRPRQVEGIRRQAPKIKFANNQEARMNSDSCNWDGKNLRVSHPGQIDNIVCIYTDTRDKPIIERAVEKLKAMAQTLGIKIGMWNVEPRAYTPEELADLMKELKSKQETTKKRYLLLHFDHKASKSHAQLKLLERRHSIVTQQITVDKAKDLPRQAQTAQNILLKLNCKIGGLNYQVIPESYSQNRWTNSKRVMFVGYDVAHPGPQSRDDVARKIPPSSPSIVGFSFNGAPNPEAFIGDFHYQTPKQERVHEEMLHQRMKWMLKLFKKNRGDLPEVIFVTRDGISEGQYEMAMTMELPSLRDACTEFGEENDKPGYKPKFVLIIATKRHSTRAFLIEHNNRVNNPKPLTVIDNTITRPNISEFYLQSAKPIIGTGKPTYYQILVDDLNLSMDEIQATMAALCFTHQIVNSPVSIPEPIYQADEWAKRGNQVWQAYEENYTLPHKKEKGDYSDFPIDFEVMTGRLSYWNSPLEMYRVNA
ncbi:hypothetical protein WR25_13012 isoform B [Diploscapter pachys]|uniref:Piwi domain-containing protein n=1 Tax=Diploscapter pachys TaxID=2018661 RepID=A0A2A2LX10_9BILA|nr:hypothetical protein WR25_13012 isoform A [Diploscapter pachys]PAV90774.1 hypothetical protein WR25_13012 isoform B [Diploscapter pachys]